MPLRQFGPSHGYNRYKSDHALALSRCDLSASMAAELVNAPQCLSSG
jgi:hypothetical protein